MQLNLFDFLFLVFIYGRILGYFTEVPVLFDLHPAIFSILLIILNIICIICYKEV